MKAVVVGPCWPSRVCPGQPSCRSPRRRRSNQGTPAWESSTSAVPWNLLAEMCRIRLLSEASTDSSRLQDRARPAGRGGAGRGASKAAGLRSGSPSLGRLRGRSAALGRLCSLSSPRGHRQERTCRTDEPKRWRSPSRPATQGGAPPRLRPATLGERLLLNRLRGCGARRRGRIPSRGRSRRAAVDRHAQVGRRAGRGGPSSAGVGWPLRGSIPTKSGSVTEQRVAVAVERATRLSPFPPRAWLRLRPGRSCCADEVSQGQWLWASNHLRTRPALRVHTHPPSGGLTRGSWARQVR